MSIKLFTWILPIVALGGLVGWRYNEKKQAERELEQKSAAGRSAAPPVEIAEATSRAMIATLDAVGTLESPYRVQISSKTTGVIEYLEAREGDVVKKGQMLVRINPSDLQDQVLQQSANVASAKSRLAEARIGTEPTATGVQAQLRQQEAEVESAEADRNQVVQNHESQVAAAQAQVTDAQARVRQVQSSLKNAEAQYTRVKTLVDKGFLARQELETAEMKVEVEQSALEAARAQQKIAEEQVAIVRRKGQADITAAEAGLKRARASLSAAKANLAQTSAYRENIEALQASVRSSEAQMRQAQTRLAETSLRSSIDGIVTSREADPGALATPGAPILVVQHLDWLFLRASLPVEESKNVRIGQTAEIRFDALPNRVFEGKVTHINPAADLRSRQFEIQIRLDNASGEMRPGMYGQVAVLLRRIEAEVVVPREAVKTGPDGKASVMVINERGEAERREVTVGASDAEGVQVLSGVRFGERVVVLSFRPIQDGQKVRIGSEPEGKK